MDKRQLAKQRRWQRPPKPVETAIAQSSNKSLKRLLHEYLEHLKLFDGKINYYWQAIVDHYIADTKYELTKISNPSYYDMLYSDEFNCMKYLWADICSNCICIRYALAGRCSDNCQWQHQRLTIAKHGSIAYLSAYTMRPVPELPADIWYCILKFLPNYERRKVLFFSNPHDIRSHKSTPYAALNRIKKEEPLWKPLPLYFNKNVTTTIPITHIGTMDDIVMRINISALSREDIAERLAVYSYPMHHTVHLKPRKK
jgi:hypothetical protein